jgi:hypothetical protein
MEFEWLGIIILSVVLGVVLYAYERSLKQVRRLKREKTEEEKKARTEAIQLVKEARQKAAEIIGEAKVNAEKWQQVMDEEMEKLTNAQLGEYKENLQKISNDIELGVQSGAEDLKKALEQETVGVEKTMVKKIEAKLAETETEVEKYKQERMAEIDQKAAIILEKVIKKVFTKAVKTSDHEALIIQELEEAKKEDAI